MEKRFLQLRTILSRLHQRLSSGQDSDTEALAGPVMDSAVLRSSEDGNEIVVHFAIRHSPLVISKSRTAALPQRLGSADPPRAGSSTSASLPCPSSFRLVAPGVRLRRLSPRSGCRRAGVY